MSVLDDMIRSLRRLGDAEAVEAAVATRGAVTLRLAVASSLDAGASPNGNPWAPRKDGGRAYANASSHLSSKAFGPLIKLTLTAPDAYGHFGVKGRMPPRPMLPDAGAAMPSLVTDALGEAATDIFDEWAQ